MWLQIAYFVAALVIGYALTPKPQVSKPAPAENIDVPVAEVGKAIPVLFGTRDLKGMNCTWYGDVATQPIKSKGGKK